MYFANNIYFAAVGDSAVVLDLERDRYIGLGRALTRAAIGLTTAREAVDGDGLADYQQARSTLVKRGILTSALNGPRPQEMPPPPVSSRWPSEEGEAPISVSRPGVGRALRALTDAAVSLRTQPFHKTIAWLRAEKRRTQGQNATASTTGLLDAYFAARPWFPIKPICRLDAIALSLSHWRSGHDVALVFGVRLEPFSAHCWVQHHDQLLNEGLDDVLQYSPIMVI